MNPTEARWQEIDALFAAALAEPPRQREAFLARASQGDEALRQAVEALLRASARAETFLERPLFTLSGGLTLAHPGGPLSRDAAAAALPAEADGPEASEPPRDLLGLWGRQLSHFRVQEVLSSGGMGVVYRAHDLRLGRTVALKFLLPQYSLDAFAKERFLQEARAASALDHPHICTVYEAGESEEGHLFLAMACYEGETLKERLARTGALPVEEAVELARQLLRGLAAAHAAGIVHRDLKPGNLMLTSEGTLKIVDFGLAKVRELSLTRSGERAGTVAYMSPEQLRGEAVDGRSDLWSVGVVLYEVLTGQLPFGAGHELAVVHRILHQEPAPLSQLRPEVPPELEGIVGQLLRKEPDERFPSSAAVLEALRGASLREPFTPGAPRAARRRAASVVRIGLLAAAMLGMATAGWLAWNSRAAGDRAVLDAKRVAVLPFRVSADPSLAYLREGMLDLVAALLTGEGGPVAVDPRTLMAAWRRAAGDGASDRSREEALALARELGAGRLVLGEVVSLADRVVLTASLSSVSTGRTAAPVRVEGPVDSLPALVDRLVAGLLSVGAGEGERLASLTTTSLPALRLYLEGQAHYRGGRYDQALTRFSRAVELDSTFALAALMTNRAARWIPGTDPDSASRALALAWRHRERLGERDRVRLLAVAGPSYPGESSIAAQLASWEALVQRQPDNAEAWFWLGDELLHYGAYLDIPDTAAWRRAGDAFGRALALDSTYLPALLHRFDVALLQGNRAEARWYGELYLARDSVGLTAEAIRLVHTAYARGTAAIPEIIARVDSVGGTFQYYALSAMYLAGSETFAIRDALADHLGRRIAEPEVAREAGWRLYQDARDRGRRTDAARYLAALRRTDRLDSLAHLAIQVRDGLYWDGDRNSSARAAHALSAQSARLAQDPAASDALCALGQWRLAEGEFTTLGPLIQRLRNVGEAGTSAAEATAFHCSELLAAGYAAEMGVPDAAVRLARLDSLLATGSQRGRLRDEGNLVLARLLEARGDLHGALRVLGRYPVHWAGEVAYHSTFLPERGRVAALMGDTPAAVEAYRRYLAMRRDPEPPLRPEVERVRAELARLARTGSR